MNRRTDPRKGVRGFIVVAVLWILAALSALFLFLATPLTNAQIVLGSLLSRLFFVIALLVYLSVKSPINTMIVLFNIPVACAGGVLALFVTRLDFSVSSAMGFIREIA